VPDHNDTRGPVHELPGQEVHDLRCEDGLPMFDLYGPRGPGAANPPLAGLSRSDPARSSAEIDPLNDIDVQEDPLTPELTFCLFGTQTETSAPSVEPTGYTDILDPPVFALGHETLHEAGDALAAQPQHEAFAHEAGDGGQSLMHPPEDVSAADVAQAHQDLAAQSHIQAGLNEAYKSIFPDHTTF
jgi:hypothetical protein